MIDTICALYPCHRAGATDDMQWVVYYMFILVSFIAFQNSVFLTLCSMFCDYGSKVMVSLKLISMTMTAILFFVDGHGFEIFDNNLRTVLKPCASSRASNMRRLQVALRVFSRRRRWQLQDPVDAFDAPHYMHSKTLPTQDAFRRRGCPCIHPVPVAT